MISSKYSIILCFVYAFALQSAECKSTASSVASTDAPSAVSSSTTEVSTSTLSIVDQLNGPSNDTCNVLSSCDTCKAKGCKWSSCNATQPSCVSVLLYHCEDIPCSSAPEPKKCSNFTTCDGCLSFTGFNCVWQACDDTGYTCDSGPGETCHALDQCNSNITTSTIPPTTVTPNDTTTVPPTTLPTTTEAPTTAPPTTTTPAQTTTDAPTTLQPNETTTAPPTTEVPTTAIPVTTTQGPAPTPSSGGGGFSAGSFFGGITLTLALLGVGFGGYRFYKMRYDVNYRTL